MGFVSTVKQMGLRLWDSNNRSLGTLFGCVSGFAVGLTAVLSHNANLPILGAPDSIAYKIIAVFLASGIGGNLSSYIGASIDILTNERTIFDLIEYGLLRCGYMKKGESSVAAPEAASAEQNRYSLFITSAIPKERVVEERCSVELQRVRISRELPSNIIRLLIDRLSEIHGQLTNLINRKEAIRTDSPQLMPVSLSIVEPVEYTPETMAQKLEAINELLRIFEHNQTHQSDIIEALGEENRKLRQELRETQARNGQLAERVMQRDNSEMAPNINQLSVTQSFH